MVVPSLRREENNLLLWNYHDLSNPVHTFSGHQDVILEFQWRSSKSIGTELCSKFFSIVGVKFYFIACAFICMKLGGIMISSLLKNFLKEN